MTPRRKAGLLGLLTHRDHAIAARARKDLGASADPAERALLETSRDRSTGLLNGPRRADRVAKSTSMPGSNAIRPGAGMGKVDGPGNPYRFAHLAPSTHQQTGGPDAAAEAEPSMIHDAAARRMLATAGITVAPTLSTDTPWQPPIPKTYPTADAAARASLAAAGIAVPKAGASNL